jgi:hypothetical protein
VTEPEENHALQSRLHWHDRAHVAWGKERLYFYRLSFAPIYIPEEIEAQLAELFREQRVGSHITYELYGSWDLLLRIWLPSDVPAESFSRSLKDTLTGLHLTQLTEFAVTDISRHWVWGGGEYPGPGEAILADERPTDHEIASVNSGEPEPDVLQRLQDLHLVTEAVHTAGLKFAMVVTPPTTELNVAQTEHFQAQLASIVDAAAGRHINDLSLYLGHGHNFGVALILGRAELRHIDAIGAALAHRISSGMSPEAIGARTVTMIIAGSEFGDFTEALPLAQEILDEADITIDEALESHEHHRAEVKGSAFLDYKRHLLGDNQLVENAAVTDALVKAVLGMLNADGGTIVLGALELVKLPDASSLPGSPVGQGRWCIGVEAEWGEEGWDGYQRRLDRLLRSRISPNPGLWIASIEPQSIDDRTVAGIFVRKPDRYWYYPAEEANKGRFYVRRGASTEEPPGADGDAYKDSNKRK